MANIIETKNLSFKYGENLPLVLDDINIEIKENEFVAILGHNGSGKSTLSKQFNAINLPVCGKCYVCSYDTSDENNLLNIRQNAGMVFQNPDNQLVATIVEDDVAFGLENLGIEPSEIRKRVDEALKEVGMYEFRLHAPHKLSGGQKQRVAIAGIIAMKPKIVIFDEPTAMLDPKGRQEVIDTIDKLNHKENVTVILITHYMEEATKADRIYVMDNGKVAMVGTPKEVFSQVDKLNNLSLDVPACTRLFYELNKKGIKVPLDTIEPDECIKVLTNLLGGKN